MDTLRARDFWAALALIGLSSFFLIRTLTIPFSSGRAGVREVAWYNSAAIVPLGIFAALLILAVCLLVVAVQAGGHRRALSGIGWDGGEATRVGCALGILGLYIAGLVPRVDFILASGLLITALVFGFHLGRPARMVTALAAVAVPALYALVRHLPQAEWRAHDDDWVTLAAWAALAAWTLWQARGPVLRWAPLVALLAPTALICAMAFGFRQNVPARTGLVFSQIEYHYYVTLRPLWSG